MIILCIDKGGIMWMCVVLPLLVSQFFMRACQENFLFAAHWPTRAAQEYQPISYLFAHGLGATKDQATMFFANKPSTTKESHYESNKSWLIQEPCFLFNFPDAKGEDLYDRKKVNLGQEEDIATLLTAYQAAVEMAPNCPLVGVGISRGSSVLINAASDMNLKALVLESPFDTITAVIKHLLDRFKVSWLPLSEKLAYKICQTHFPQIKIDGICPLYMLEKIPADLPIIFIHSKKDKVVPINSSRRLYMKLRQLGHEHVYLVELASGNHGKLLIGPDSEFYLLTVHAFYKKYGLPHDPDYAQRGAHLLALCQPSIAEVAQRLKKTRTEREDNDNNNEKSAFEELAFAEIKNALIETVMVA